MQRSRECERSEAFDEMARDEATLMCGGILTSICMWSAHASASIISTPFCTHNFLNISPISFLISPYIAFLLNFGANTM